MSQGRVLHSGMDCTCGKIGTDHSKIKRWTVHVGEEVRTKKKYCTCVRMLLIFSHSRSEQFW